MLEGLKDAAQRVADERALRALMLDCKRLLSERGEANSVAIARGLAVRFATLPDALQTRFFERLAHDFSPDPQAVLAGAHAYAALPSADNLIALQAGGRAAAPGVAAPDQSRRRAAPPRSCACARALLVAAGGAAASCARSRPTCCTCCRAGSTPASCRLRRVDWNSPAQLLEQIIRHEAVHEIDGWDDLRRRLQPDRRCFAFFHPQLPDEPLIFVEVALLPEMPDAIAPLIDKRAAAGRPAPLQGRGVLLDQQLPAGAARRVARQLPDQARGRGAASASCRS